MLPEITGLMSEVGFDVNRTSCSSGLPPLALAAFEGRVASIRLLLEDAPGIKVNQAESTSGRMPLYIAVYMGHETCVRLLLGVETVGAQGFRCSIDSLHEVVDTFGVASASTVTGSLLVFL